MIRNLARFSLASAALAVWGLLALGGAPEAKEPEPEVGPYAGMPGVKVIRDLRREYNSPEVDPTEERIVSLVTTGNPDSEVPLPRQAPDLYRIASTVKVFAERHEIEPELVGRLIWVESRGDSLATSPVNAQGLMQVMPRYWQGEYPECGDNLYRVRDNICYGVKILRMYKNAHPGDLREALLAYNGCVTRSKCSWYAGSVARFID